MQSLIICKSPYLGGIGAFDGHLYEMVEYAYILKDKYDVKMYVTDDMVKNITSIINWRYMFTAVDRDALHCMIETYSSVIDEPDAIMLNVDGYLDLFDASAIRVNVKHVFTLRCFATYLDSISIFAKSHSVTLLEDSRIYSQTFENVTQKHYVKKILFDKFFKVDNSPENCYFLYFNNECKRFSLTNFMRLRKKYDNFYIVGPPDLAYLDSLENVMFETIPANDIFSKFSTLVYFGTTLDAVKEDCSCRLICEAVHYGKDIVFECDYELDKPTQIRLKDAENIDTLNLTKDDEIFKLLEITHVED